MTEEDVEASPNEDRDERSDTGEDVEAIAGDDTDGGVRTQDGEEESSELEDDLLSADTTERNDDVVMRPERPSEEESLIDAPRESGETPKRSPQTSEREPADPESEWDEWIWGDSTEFEDEKLTAPYNELRESITEDDQPFEDRSESDSAIDTDESPTELDRGEPGAPGGRAKGVTDQSSPSAKFEELLERVERRKERIERSEAPYSERHDLAEIPEVRTANKVLIIDPPGSNAAEETCLSGFDLVDLADQRVLLISLDRLGPTRLELFLKRFGMEEVADLAHIGPMIDESLADNENIRMVRLSDPGDLTHLGISVSMIIADWNDSSDQITICLHSLTDMIQSVNDTRVFRFLHLLLARLEDRAKLHVHIDANSHEREVFGIYGELFDVTVEVTQDGLQVLP